MTFPAIFRNTYRSAFVRCPTLARYLYEEGLEVTNIDLHAGGAFARGIEVTRKAYYNACKPPALAIEAGRKSLSAFYGDFPCPPTSNKTRERMEGALYYYFEQWPLGASDELKPVVLPSRELGVELQFSVPTGIGHPETGADIPYTGILDMLAEDEDGDVWVVDEKTTGKLGDSWANQWYLDAGLAGYVWWARRALPERRVVGVKVRGIGIYKAGYGKMEVPVLVGDWETERWHAQMLRDLREWVDSSFQGTHRMALSHACALYNNPCPCLPLCKSREPMQLLQQMKDQAKSERERLAHIPSRLD